MRQGTTSKVLQPHKSHTQVMTLSPGWEPGVSKAPGGQAKHNLVSHMPPLILAQTALLLSIVTMHGEKNNVSILENNLLKVKE